MKWPLVRKWTKECDILKLWNITQQSKMKGDKDSDPVAFHTPALTMALLIMSSEPTLSPLLQVGSTGDSGPWKCSQPLAGRSCRLGLWLPGCSEGCAQPTVTMVGGLTMPFYKKRDKIQLNKGTV
jgi:hypothetical protein